jgi:hypothetical protein
MTTGNIEMEAGATRTEQLAESLQTIRGVVVVETAKMATNAPHISPMITEFATGMLETVRHFEDLMETQGRDTSEMMSAESLYRPLVHDASPTTEIVRIYQVINEYDKHLVNAVRDYDEEVPREAEMTLFRRIPYELDYLNIGGSNIGEVATALKVALLGNNTRPYRLEQIMSLRKILDFVKKDISVGERTLMEILSILDDQFGLAGPLAEVKFIG